MGVQISARAPIAETNNGLNKLQNHLLVVKVDYSFSTLKCVVVRREPLESVKQNKIRGVVRFVSKKQKGKIKYHCSIYRAIYMRPAALSSASSHSPLKITMLSIL